VPAEAVPSCANCCSTRSSDVPSTAWIHIHSSRSRAAWPYFAAYDAVLRRWPAAYESRTISTSFGSTQVLISGPEGAPPFVLLHGMSMSATMWWPNIADWSRARRVYAVDTIGDVGRSVATRPLRTQAEYVTWYREVLDGHGRRARDGRAVVPGLEALQPGGCRLSDGLLGRRPARAVGTHFTADRRARGHLSNRDAVLGRARRLVPKLEADFVPGACHVPTVEQPAWTNARVLRFLEATPA
jgi:pimeloyl-ACP methyl ester carboxylesterase